MHSLCRQVGPQVLWSEIFTVPTRPVYNAGLTTWNSVPELLCAQWLQVYTTVSSLTYGGSIIILVINILLRTVLKVLVRMRTETS